MRHKLILAGGGSGTAEYLLPAAKKALEEVELVIASPRFLELLHARKTMPMGHISELLESLPAMLERESIGIVVSGDPLLDVYKRQAGHRVRKGRSINSGSRVPLCRQHGERQRISGAASQWENVGGNAVSGKHHWRIPALVFSRQSGISHAVCRGLSGVSGEKLSLIHI